MPEQICTTNNATCELCRLGRPRPHNYKKWVAQTEWCREAQNHGVLIPETVPETDFQATGLTGITFMSNEEDGDWIKYFTGGEKQHGIYFDSASCVTFSALRSISLQINRLIRKKLLPVATLQFLETAGYLDEQGYFNVSERFTAKMSGTTRAGNYFKAVWDSIRKDGLLPQKDWNFPTEQRTPVFDWDNYYAEIPEELKVKAREILKYFSFAYEWVLAGEKLSSEARLALLRQHLRQAPLQIAAPVCGGWNSGGEIAVPNCGRTATEHATIIATIDTEGVYYDIDSYIPYLKKLSTDYPFNWVMKGVVELAQPPVDLPPFEDKFDTTQAIEFGQKGALVMKLQRVLVKLGYLQKQYLTGLYWTITQAAVRKFQMDYRVDSYAVLTHLNGKRVGPKTLAKLNELLLSTL